MTVSAARVFALRLADVRRRINRSLDTARSVAYGTHEAFHIGGALRWMQLQPDAPISEFMRWRDELRIIGQARMDTLEKRLAFVERIAARQVAP